MSCAYHKRESKNIEGVITQVKIYNPAFSRTVFKSIPVIWFRKIEIDATDGVHYTLYDFQVKDKPETRTIVEGQPKKGKRATATYFPLSKQVRGCIKIIQC